MCDRPPAASGGGAEDSGQFALRGDSRWNRRPRAHAAAAWQHGQVPCSAWIPLSPAYGKRQ